MANTHAASLTASSSHYFSIADNAALSITGDMAFECWVTLSSSPGTNETRSIVTKGTTGDSQFAYSFLYRDQDGTPQLQFTISDNGATPVTQAAVDQTLSTSTCYHLGVSYDASAGEATFVIDGTEHASSPVGSLDTSVADTTAAFEVGRGGRGGGDADYWDGTIDDLRIWNTERTPTQFNDNKDAELGGSESGLVAYYKFNNNADDSQASGANDLTEQNSVGYTSSGLCFGSTFKPSVMMF